MKKLASAAMGMIGLMTISANAMCGESFKNLMSEYLDFATYSDGVITVPQLYAIGFENVTLVNTGSKDGYEASHIPGSHHIDWRQVLERSDEIPKQGLVVVYCKNSLVSAKAQLLLSLAGYENVKVLSRGYTGWKDFQSRSKDFAMLE